MTSTNQNLPPVAIYKTRNTYLAAYLGTIGVPFYEKEPLVYIEDPAGQKKITVWQFQPDHPLNGRKTKDIAGAWERRDIFQDMETPQAHAAAALDTYQYLLKSIKESRPFVRYVVDGQVVLVTKGSRRQRALEEQVTKLNQPAQP